MDGWMDGWIGNQKIELEFKLRWSFSVSNVFEGDIWRGRCVNLLIGCLVWKMALVVDGCWLEIDQKIMNACYVVILVIIINDDDDSVAQTGERCIICLSNVV